MTRSGDDPYPAPVEPSATFQAALAGMVDRPFLASQKQASDQWRANRQGLHPALIDFDERLVKRMGSLGVPMFMFTGVRSREAQAEAYALGHSHARPGTGPHEFGCAVDIVHSVKAWGLDVKQWAVIGHVGKEVAASAGLKLVWGGDFHSIYDAAHWEVADWHAAKAGFPFRADVVISADGHFVPPERG